jgi:hypothetical protein
LSASLITQRPLASDAQVRNILSTERDFRVAKKKKLGIWRAPLVDQNSQPTLNKTKRGAFEADLRDLLPSDFEIGVVYGLRPTPKKLKLLLFYQVITMHSCRRDVV